MTEPDPPPEWGKVDTLLWGAVILALLGYLAVVLWGLEPIG